MIDKLVRKQIISMRDINWGEIPDSAGMRLLWGENPMLVKLYKDAIISAVSRINYYPSPTKQALREKLARYNNLKPDNIIITNGSDEALELIGKVFIAENDEVIIPVPSYPCFTTVSQMMGATIVPVRLNTRFKLPVKYLVSKVTDKTKIIWIANPNNPTGNLLFSFPQLEELIKSIKCILVLDECYFEFGKVTAVSLLEKYPNVIITRSFTKAFALAGVRLGYIIANEGAAFYLNRLEQANQVFNVNSFALSTGEALLNDQKVLKKIIFDFEVMKRDFERLLKKIKKITVLATKTSFCLLNISETGLSASELKNELLKQNIYIKDCSIYEGLGSEFIYLGVPDRKSQITFIKSLTNVINSNYKRKEVNYVTNLQLVKN